MTFIIYIGNNKEYITHFKTLLNEDISIVSNIEEAFVILNGLPSNKIQPILYEKSDLESDKINIAYLRMKFRNSYIILITEQLESKEKKIYLGAGTNNTISPNADLAALETIHNFISKSETLRRFEYEKIDQVYKLPQGKRIFDIVISLFALIMLSPLLLLITLLIVIESRGPIIYKSKRVGSNFQIFDFLKFRSMYIDAEQRLANYQNLNQYQKVKLEENLNNETEDECSSDEDPILISDDFEISEHQYLNQKKEKKQTTFLKLSHDPRVTKIGRFIRKYSIDELPQLINILKGDMSIVGNRPLPLYEAELLTGDDYIDRFIAPAGLTGLWQVEKRGEKGNMSPEERKQLDIYYAKHYSIWLDLKILIKTFFSFIQKEDA